MANYIPTDWKDEIKDGAGNVVQKGTPLSAANLKKLEAGVEGAVAAVVGKVDGAVFDEFKTATTTLLAETAKKSTGGNPRGVNALDLQYTRVAPDQVAGAKSSVIAGGERNKIQNIVERDSDAQYSHVEGFGNRAHEWGAHAEGYNSIADGKISHAEGNGVICSANDSHAEGNRTVTGRRYYRNVTFGSEDAGDGLGVLNYVTIPSDEGDVSSFFPNVLLDNLLVRYGSGAQKDAKGNIYPTGMKQAIWTGNVPTTPNDLRWAMHSICIVRGTSEGNIDFVNIAKSIFSDGVGTKVYYYGTMPFPSLIGIYTSYSPTLIVNGKYQAGNGSHAEGYITSAVGYGSHAEGYFTRAWGTGSHAEGREGMALGNYSHAGGYQTEALGDISHATGEHSKALRNYQKSFGVKMISTKGDNQLTDILYTKKCAGVGWHTIDILKDCEDGKAYHFETMVIGRQTAGSAGNLGDTFAYKFTGCFLRSEGVFTELGTPTRTLVGRSASMTGDGLAAGVRLSWSNLFTSNAAHLRYDGILDTTFQVTTYNKIQEMGFVSSN